MKQKRFATMLCVLSSVFMLSGCAMHVPVIIPDDENVLSLSSSVVKDLSSLNVSVDGIMLYGTDTKGYQVTYKGSLSGDISDVLSGKMHMEKASATSKKDSDWEVAVNKSDNITVSDDVVSNDIEWYRDTKNNAYYEKQTETKWIGYSNGSSVMDIAWWQNQLKENTAFKYGGKAKSSNDKSCYLLEATYSGDDAVSLMQHLGIRQNVSASTSDLHVNAYVNKWSGMPVDVEISASDTGSQIMISDDDVSNKLSMFHFRLLFSDDAASDVSIPKDVTSLNLIEPTNQILMTDSAEIDEKKGLRLHDMYVNVTKSDVFNTVKYDTDKNMISVSSDTKLDGQPSMSVSLIDNGDAYLTAVSDKDAILDFYNSLGLSELYVSPDVLQTAIDGCPMYVYHAQYTDSENGFVNTNYFAYIMLSESSFAKVVISSMVDPGVNVVLTDGYANSMLSQITVVKGGD